MNNLIYTLGRILAGLALFVTAANVNINCTFVAHQPKLPHGAERFRKNK
ncbi:MAG: hypothetical protein K0S01_133 [Herbinix sp.]|jgi:cyclic lactone autoinducer peptide|nr:hypothetical protein [Herbinix sp.]